MAEPLSNEAIAQVCHEAQRAYSMILGDHTVRPWDAAPEWQRLSAIAGVKAAQAPNMTAKGMHEAWLAYKQKAGWKYGPTKRPEALEHPCMVPWDELPEALRVKDALFLAVVRALSPLPGLAKEPAVPDAVVAKAVLEHEAESKGEPPAPMVEHAEKRSKHKKSFL